MTAIPLVVDDGGRAAAGYRGAAGDCVCRAIAIATGKPYREVYDELTALTKAWLAKPARGWRQRDYKKRCARDGASPRNGSSREVAAQYLAGLGWRWTPTMAIGAGCQVHLRADELPPGRLVLSLSRHFAAVVDGVLHDTHDCSRDGTRCVYGYWEAPHIQACPWCGAAVPPKSRGSDRRFCSASCKAAWHRACHRVGELVLTRSPKSVDALSGDDLDLARAALPPRLPPDRKKRPMSDLAQRHPWLQHYDAIYAPAGQAGEYAPLATNPYRGCGHDCLYCYVPAAIKMDRRAFHAGSVPKPDFADRVLKCARRCQREGITEQVLLSFSTDPYPPAHHLLTRTVLEILRDHELAYCTLTKGGHRALRDLDLFRPDRDAFASTLTSLDRDFSRKWERSATDPAERIDTLRRFHDAGSLPG